MSTIKDLAKYTNLSISTVSKAFNGYSEIPEHTKKKIFDAAKVLNYVPNKYAVQLTGNSPEYIGFIVRDIVFDISTYEFQFKILAGLMRGCNKNKKELLIFTLSNIKNSNMSFSNFCQYHKLSGALVLGLEMNDELIKEIEETKIPILLVDMNHKNPKTSSISTDNFNACKEVFKLFYNNGHRNILYITGTNEAEITHIREEGFLNGISTYSNNDCKIHRLVGQYTEQDAYIAVKDFIKNNRDITAVFAFSDFMSIGASKALSEANFQVGKDITIIGFDGSEITNYTSPKLATVYQDFERIGEDSITALIDLEKSGKHKNILIPFKILPKESIHKL